MSRLIRDTDLIAALEKWKNELPPYGSVPHHLDLTNTVIRNVLKAVINVINDQPTAYDVEAVVRELEKLKMAEYDDSDEEPCYEDAEDIYEEGVSAGKFKAYHKAIEIVRGGRNERTD